LANPKTWSLRFELKEKNGDDENFQVIIRKVEDSYVFKADYVNFEDRDCKLRLFTDLEEMIFYFEDADNRVYFHLS